MQISSSMSVRNPVVYLVDKLIALRVFGNVLGIYDFVEAFWEF